MLPTPSTSHVDYDRVYEPAEDSYLLLDTLSSANESQFLKAHFSNGTSPLLCEVGTGSGVVLAFVTAHASSILGRRDAITLGTDMNGFACTATATTVNTAARAHADSTAYFLGAVAADLTTPLRDGVVDLLIFNPPYVPAPLPDALRQLPADGLDSRARFEQDSHLLALAYAGGEDGMVVASRLLQDLPRLLSARGVAYILLCAQNRPDAVRRSVLEWPGGWSAEVVGSSGNKAGWEKLVILRIWRRES